MRLRVLGHGFFFASLLGAPSAIGCAGNGASAQGAGGAPVSMLAASTNVQVVRCASEASGCFDAAKALCGGAWHQVAEPGMPFPAIVNDEQDGYRMLVACENGAVK